MNQSDGLKRQGHEDEDNDGTVTGEGSAVGTSAPAVEEEYKEDENVPVEVVGASFPPLEAFASCKPLQVKDG